MLGYRDKPSLLISAEGLTCSEIIYGRRYSIQCDLSGTLAIVGERGQKAITYQSNTTSLIRVRWTFQRSEKDSYTITACGLPLLMVASAMWWYHHDSRKLNRELERGRPGHY